MGHIIYPKPDRWTCNGAVRGTCGIVHRDWWAAWKCCQRDATATLRKLGHGAVIDREPVKVERP